MGKENTVKNISPQKRKWRMDDLHQSRVDGFAERTRYYLRNQKRKIMMVKASGNNARRKKCEECV
jgi:hypothetical protein